MSDTVDLKVSVGSAVITVVLTMRWLHPSERKKKVGSSENQREISSQEWKPMCLPMCLGKHISAFTQFLKREKLFSLHIKTSK